ncbi:Endonuclease III [Luteitalea pratensis]|uniref:Endonuclease III n=1 Tax=Luteitalea pratensis TaxID=1855912 RepID=A0A143PFU8_LUTPR|nr:Endonuclease III [Luteitalea pratensis]
MVRALSVPTLRPPLPVAPTLKRLGVAIRSLELPAIEKIGEESMGDAFQVLVSTMLSAQTKDAVTLASSLRLFAVAPDPASLARLTTSRIEKLIYPVSFYRNKAVHLKETARILVRDFAGAVPTTMDALLTLPGVGRKTANLTLIVACRSRDNICVDTHVHRIANRFGWVRTRMPEQTERALYEVAPRRWWATINLHLVTWGQHVCKPVFPQCGRCILNDTCPKIGVVREGRVA